MLRGIVFIQLGVRDPAGEPDSNRKEPIFHNDLSACNVFLSSKGTDSKTIKMGLAYPRIVIGDLGYTNTESATLAYYAKLHGPHSIPWERAENRDTNAVCTIMDLFMCKPESCKPSKELHELMTCLKGIKDGSMSLLTLLKTLILTKERLVNEGKLTFKPILE